MLKQYKRNTAGIKNYATGKKDLALKKADDAINRLLKVGEKVNFNSVAQEGNVSKAYLYKTPQLRSRIEDLRKKQDGLPSVRQLKREMSDASKDVLIAAQNKRIKELETEIRQLKEELLHLRGTFYDMQ